MQLVVMQSGYYASGCYCAWLLLQFSNNDLQIAGFVVLLAIDSMVVSVTGG